MGVSMSDDNSGNDLQEIKMLITHLHSALSEQQSWLALLMCAHGSSDHGVVTYRMPSWAADRLRAEMPRGQLQVAIDYDVDSDSFVLTAI